MATEETEPLAGAPRTPRSARLPQLTLESAVGLTQALHNLAGPASIARIAEAVGSPVTSAQFQSRVAAAQYFGLIDKTTGGKFAPTARGIAVLEGTDEERLLALRHSVLATGAGKLLVERLSGRSANEQVIRTRLEEDLGVPPGPAERIARTLLASAQHAELVKADRFDAVAIEDAWESLPKEQEKAPVRRDGQGQQPKPPPTKANSRKTPASPQLDQLQNEGGAGKMKAPPFARTVNLSIALNISHLSVDEIVELVSKLATSAQSS